MSQPSSHPSYRVARWSDFRPPVPDTPGKYEWKPVRRHFDIRSFGINAAFARHAGDILVGEHTEVEDGCRNHEELYFLAAGRAEFTVDGERVPLDSGTFLYIRDPEVTRSARALEDGTVAIAIGGERGRAFEISGWEAKYDQEPPAGAS